MRELSETGDDSIIVCGAPLKQLHNIHVLILQNVQCIVCMHSRLALKRALSCDDTHVTRQ